MTHPVLSQRPVEGGENDPPVFTSQMLLLRECAVTPTGDGEQGFRHAKHALHQASHTPLAYSLNNFQIIYYGQNMQERSVPVVSQVGEDSTLKTLKNTMGLGI